MTRTRFKICGTTSVPDALLAQEVGADAVGLIFAASRRQVDVARAREISLALDPSVSRVGVFLGAGLDEVLRTADAARLSAVQLHGPVSDLYVAAVLRYYPVLRVARPGDELPVAQAGLTVMFDAPNPGSGVPLDWDALREDFPAGAWLAGGLGPENVRRAIAVLRPAGVDAVSALEAAPGVKDARKVRAFAAAVSASEIVKNDGGSPSYPQ